MNDNKSEGAVVVEGQPERSGAVSADGAAQGESAAARDSSARAVKESPPAATVAKPTEGGMQAANAKAAGIDGDGGKPGAKDKAADVDAARAKPRRILDRGPRRPRSERR